MGEYFKVDGRTKTNIVKINEDKFVCVILQTVDPLVVNNNPTFGRNIYK